VLVTGPDELAQAFANLGFTVVRAAETLAGIDAAVITNESSSELRRGVVRAGIPYFTTVRAAEAAIAAIAAMRAQPLAVSSLQHLLVSATSEAVR
jgi:hypothetical protein